MDETLQQSIYPLPEMESQHVGDLKWWEDVIHAPSTSKPPKLLNPNPKP